MPKIPKALHRFSWEYRRILDANGAEIGKAVPPDTDTRMPRAQQCGRETSGYIVAHTGRNRARRRELGRDYGVTMPGSNRPVVDKLTLADIVAVVE